MLPLSQLWHIHFMSINRFLLWLLSILYSFFMYFGVSVGFGANEFEANEMQLRQNLIAALHDEQFSPLVAYDRTETILAKTSDDKKVEMERSNNDLSVVIVILESVRASSTSLYNKSLPFRTTPFLQVYI